MFGNGGGTIWDYFCNHRCLMDFVSKHTQAMLNIEPRLEALETPIDVVVETKFDYHDNPYKIKVIKEVDNSERVG